MCYQQKNLVPIQQEITNTKRQIDEIEWEGGSCEHLHKHLDSLVDLMLGGEVWYPRF